MDKDKKILLNKLGKNICRLRKAKGLTQVELANIIDKDQQSIQRLEKGNINPSVYYLSQLSRGLGIDLMELFDFSEEINKEK